MNPEKRLSKTRYIQRSTIDEWCQVPCNRTHFAEMGLFIQPRYNGKKIDLNVLVIGTFQVAQCTSSIERFDRGLLCILCSIFHCRLTLR